MKIKALRNGFKPVENGKIYEVITEKVSQFKIIDDEKLGRYYPKSIFEIVKQKKKRKPKVEVEDLGDVEC